MESPICISRNDSNTVIQIFTKKNFVQKILDSGLLKRMLKRAFKDKTKNYCYIASAETKCYLLIRRHMTLDK